MEHVTLSQRSRYRFDNFMARGGSSIFVSLLLVFLGLMVLIVVVRGAIHFGVKLIPEKNARYTLQPDDCLIVVAEDDR